MEDCGEIMKLNGPRSSLGKRRQTTLSPGVVDQTVLLGRMTSPFFLDPLAAATYCP